MEETKAMDSRTRMVKPIPEGTKMVKIKALRPIKVTTAGNKHKVMQPGEVAEVPEYEAKEFVERTIDGMYPFSGERFESDGDCRIEKIRRAELVV